MIASKEPRTIHPQADRGCVHCRGTGYVRLEAFDPFTGDLDVVVDVCECVTNKQENHRDAR
jgi:hypothetical protein